MDIITQGDKTTFIFNFIRGEGIGLFSTVNAAEILKEYYINRILGANPAGYLQVCLPKIEYVEWLTRHDGSNWSCQLETTQEENILDDSLILKLHMSTQTAILFRLEFQI